MSEAVRFKLNWDIVCCSRLLEPAAALLLPEHLLPSSSPSQAAQLDPPFPGSRCAAGSGGKSSEINVLSPNRSLFVSQLDVSPVADADKET